MSSVPGRTFRKHLLAEIVLTCIGCALVAAAIAANQAWLDRHFLPAFFVSRAQYVRMETNARIAVAVAGALLALVLRRPLARFGGANLFSIFLALMLSIGAAELVLRRTHVRAAEEVPPTKEPQRHLDARAGWLFTPSHVGFQQNHGRPIEYAFDRNGYRVPRVTAPVDFAQPTIVFTGESMMVGEKLAWPETIPAQTSALLGGVQSANLAVSGFATDQAYMRLAAELPRFRRPVAVVSLFAPSIFDRNLDDDRPHLGPGLVWSPPAARWRLVSLARRVIKYRSDDEIARGVQMTRDVLAATIRLARSRGAVPVIVVPQFGAEEPRERELRRRILDDAGLPYVFVQLDPKHRIEGDGHPDAYAARQIAAAIATRVSKSRL